MFTADPKKDVEGAYAAWDAAFNSGDTKTIAAAYLQNAKLLAGALASGITDHKLEVLDADGDGKIIYSTARWSAKGKDKGGIPTTFSGFATYIFERQADNSLKLLLQTWN